MHAHVTIRLAAVLLACAGLSAQQPPPKTPDHMQHRFDDPARYAKSFDDPKRDAWQLPDRVIAALELKPGMGVADVGAGTGYFSVRLARVSPALTVYAADIEPKMVEHLKERSAAEKLTNIVPVLAAAASPNLPRPVDLILIVDTYHHIADRPAYFRALRRSLTAGGRVAIVDFRKDAPEGPPAHFRFTPAEIEAEMKQAGYAMAASHDFLPRQHFLIFR
jgi:cyclopropane fatty-acyl-phospholipid synthase-like methyltransferase